MLEPPPPSIRSSHKFRTPGKENSPRPSSGESLATRRECQIGHSTPLLGVSFVSSMTRNEESCIGASVTADGHEMTFAEVVDFRCWRNLTFGEKLDVHRWNKSAALRVPNKS